MHILQQIFYKNEWQRISGSTDTSSADANLVLVFGDAGILNHDAFYDNLKIQYPVADIIMCSTAGEITNDAAYENSVSLTAVRFDKTAIKCISTNISRHANSYETGKFLRSNFDNEGLKCVFIISDGTKINGSELVDGLNELNNNGVLISGGLAGDGAKFEKTYTALNGVCGEGNVVAVGFYGDHIQVGHGSLGGWDEFCPQKTISKSEKNVLYEIDGKSALDLYKEYLGPFKDELPGSALLFPISITENKEDDKVVRTILSIDEEKKSMTFAGNMPEGSKVRLMKANFDKLVDASATAAKQTLSTLNNTPELAILISCIGRKLVLQERVSEEVAAAKEVLGNNTCITGFYSYGEISPLQNFDRNCELHNQTMTITALKEI